HSAGRQEPPSQRRAGVGALVLRRMLRLNSILRQWCAPYRSKDHRRVSMEGKENMAPAPVTSEISDLSGKRERLLNIIRRESLLTDREFRLTSGRSSNFFIDLKKTMFDPEGASLLADLLFDRIKEEDVDYIGGMEAGGIPIVATLSMRSW